MPVDPMVIAAGISAAGNLAGNLVGGSDGPDHLRKRTRQANYAAIEGKMQAAKEFGISPLYALGASTMSPGGAVSGNDPGLGAAIADMGQDVSRAVAATQTEAERAIQALTLEKAGLENDFLRAQIQSVNMRTARESGPAYPVEPVTQRPLPGMPGSTWGVQYPGLGNTMENDYSEIGGNIFGGAALVNDGVRNLEAWFRRTFPSMERLEPYLPFNINR